MPLIFRIEVPVFLSVTTLAALTAPTLVLAKVRLAGVRETVGAVVPPVPVRLAVCGEFTASS